MRLVITKDQEALRPDLIKKLETFDQQGEELGDQPRNTIKRVTLAELELTIKHFRIPNFFNQLIYGLFRKSKARRSFEYAKTLIAHQLNTPKPIAYAEEYKGFLFKKSYYICDYLPYDFTYRALIHQPDFPEREKILRAFTHFTFHLHEAGIEFLDHSPGNTLIIHRGDTYEFYLVDLNRMRFHQSMSYHQRLRNFVRLSRYDDMVRIMGEEYAALIHQPTKKVVKDLLAVNHKFWKAYDRKQRWKKKLKGK